jgi:hypothetical protein
MEGSAEDEDPEGAGGGGEAVRDTVAVEAAGEDRGSAEVVDGVSSAPGAAGAAGAPQEEGREGGERGFWSCEWIATCGTTLGSVVMLALNFWPTLLAGAGCGLYEMPAWLEWTRTGAVCTMEPALAWAVWGVVLAAQMISWLGETYIVWESRRQPASRRTWANAFAPRNWLAYVCFTAVGALMMQLQSAFAFAALGIVGLLLAFVAFALIPLLAGLRMSLSLSVPISVVEKTMRYAIPLLTSRTGVSPP